MNYREVIRINIHTIITYFT